MYVKTTNGQLSKFPYTLGELRRDNPNISFPKEISEETLATFGVYKVEDTQPETIDSKTHRYLKSVSFVDNKWTVLWTIQQLPIETASSNIRAYRDSLLSKTDWRFRSDMNPTQEWIDYCQALRDVPAQDGFPYSITWPSQPE